MTSSETFLAPRPAILAMLLLTACAGGGPSLDPIDDQVAAVGSEFVLELRASNDSGAPIEFSYSTDARVDSERGRLTQRPGGGAVFSWTPSAQDIGEWTFDFQASDASGSATESIRLGVKSAIGADSMPIFRRPLGAGTTLDLETQDCVEIELLLEDRDSFELVIAQEEPIIPGSELYQETPLSAIWSFCPSPEQFAEKERYLLTLSADDGENPKALKHYQIVLRQGMGQDCRGGQPVIDHVPVDLSSTRDLSFNARIQDPSGLKASPLFYWSSTGIAGPDDLDRASQLQMELISGDTRDGQWGVLVPNILALDPSSSSRTLHYAIIADDDDDQGGACDHVAIESYSIEIGRPSGPQGPGLGLCEPCSADIQCGDAEDLCLLDGASGSSHCFSACEAGSCPEGFTCPEAPMSSVDGASARVCVPLSGSCQEPGACVDDAMEPNGSLSDAAPLSAASESEELILCPKADLVSDEDWFQIEVLEPSYLNVYIAGDLEEDEVDIRLVDGEGGVIARSENWGPSDNVGRCVPPGTYYAVVYSSFDRAHRYDIGYSLEAESCEVSTCEDDLYEDDDDLIYGRVTDLSEGHNSSGNAICPYDEDWYFVFLEAGEDIFVRLDFEQAGAYEDLDVLLFNGNSEEWITECTDERPDLCDPDNGQSPDSNERFRHTVEETGYYYVVIRGFAGSANTYDICLSRDAEHCDMQ